MSEQQTAAAGAKHPRSEKRKLTKEELANISRANGAKSRGATTAAGAARARRGNYKHGLACEILPMETEDGAAIAETVLDWYTYFRPASPLARTLTKICARSDVMLDRCYTFLDTTTDGQGREVFQAWEEARTTLVTDLVALLPTTPDQAISGLKQFGHGCRWLLNEWTHHQDGLLRYGFWPLEIWPDVVRLLGADPDLDRIGGSEPAFLAALFNFQCQPQPAVAQIAALSAPHRRPATLAQLRLPAALPAPEESRRRLRDLVATEIEELRRLEQALRLGKDRADLERVLKQTLVLNDDAPSRQFLRYHKEWCGQFFRASRVLPLALQRDASGFFDELGASDDEPETLSPWERVPQTPTCPSDILSQGERLRVRADAPPGAEASEASEGRVSASAPPGAEASEASEGRVSASAPPSAEASGAAEGQARVDAPPSADASHSPTDDEAGTEAVEHHESVAEEPPRSDPPSGALPASADPAVAEAGSVTDRVGFPDPPSSKPVLTTQVSGFSGIAPQNAGTDAPGSRQQPGSAAGAAPAPCGPQAAPRLIQEEIRPPDRGPPIVRGSPHSHDGDPRAVP
jgi:hypothetical protein